MTYAVVFPPNLLRRLVMIRTITDESIRSIIMKAVEDRTETILEGMEIIHGKEFVQKLETVTNEQYHR